MKTSLLSLLVCRQCSSGFSLLPRYVEDEEVMEGSLRCDGCPSCFPITRGIPRFLSPALEPEKKATAAAFAYEWTHYSQLTEADRKEFMAWVDPLMPPDFRHQVVLDAGCGKGRHIALAAEFGARMVVGIDLSDAVEAAFRNTRHLPNVHVVQADIMDLPFANPFTLVYCIGVLHHLPVPKQGFLALTRHVQPGGRIATWVYGKEGNLWIELFVDPVRKRITSRLPKGVTRCLSFPPAVLLFTALRLLYRPARSRPRLRMLLPYCDYLCSIADYTFAENFWNVFDQLIAPTAFYHSREEVMDWYRTAELQEISVERLHGNSWRGTAKIRESDMEAPQG